jgi:hypothetical protein
LKGAKITPIPLPSSPRRVTVASHEAGGLSIETDFGETVVKVGITLKLATLLALGGLAFQGTGTAGGMSRLNDEYWTRQAENEAAVKEAKARRDAAVTARNAARF